MPGINTDVWYTDAWYGDAWYSNAWYKYRLVGLLVVDDELDLWLLFRSGLLGWRRRRRKQVVFLGRTLGRTRHGDSYVTRQKTCAKWGVRASSQRTR